MNQPNPGTTVPICGYDNCRQPDHQGHPAQRFAKEIGARSVVLPSPARHERRTDTGGDAKKIWSLYGPELEF